MRLAELNAELNMDESSDNEKVEHPEKPSVLNKIKELSSQIKEPQKFTHEPEVR